MELKEYIKKLRLDSGLNQEEFAETLGIKPVQISKYESGKGTPGLYVVQMLGKIHDADIDFMKLKIFKIKTADISKKWTIPNKPLKSTDYQHSVAEDAIEYAGGKLRMIPVINQTICGNWCDFTDLDYPVGHADRWEPEPTKDKNAFYIVASGDSMTGREPDIREGDLLLVEPNKSPENGDIVLAKSNKGCTVKVYFNRGEHIELRPLNPTHDSVIIKGGENSRVFKITKLTRDFNRERS